MSLLLLLDGGGSSTQAGSRSYFGWWLGGYGATPPVTSGYGFLLLEEEYMNTRTIKKGSTDQSVVIRILDSTTFLPETAVEHNTSGIDLWYRREGAAKTSIVEVALTALTDAHSDGGIEHIGDGYYRLDPPDDAFASGANGVAIGGTVTGMVIVGCYVHLVDYDPQDTVRLGLTALPNAAADAAGGLPISDAGGLDLDAQIGTKINDILTDTGTTLQAEVDGIQADTEDIQSRLPAALVSGRIDASVGAYQTGLTPLQPTTAGRTLDVTATGAAGIDWGNVENPTTSVSFTNTTIATVTTTTTATNVTTVNGLAANVITAAATASDFGTEVGTAVWASATRTLTSLSGLTVDTVTTLTNLPAITANWLTAAGTAADFGTEIGAAVLSALGTGTWATAIPWNASWDAEVQSEVQDALDGTVADSVPADGTRPSVSSGIYMMTQALVECSISGTTMTVKKPDGTTTLYTVTLNDGTTPTAKTRSG